VSAPEGAPVVNHWRSIGISCAKLAVFGLVVWGLVWLVGSLSGPAGEDGGNDSKHEAIALMNCKDAVKERLRNPATAHFPLLDTNIEDQSDGWVISGMVTAETDFGVKKELTYRCEAGSSGTVTDVSVVQ
jgi:hypothetical protein